MNSKYKDILNLTVIVSALGYFVDIFDLLLFGVVRIPSLKDLGIPQDQLLTVGVMLLNRQMLGLLLGGIFWGVLGDKLGRVSVLFGSIFLYSSANLLNAFVHSVDAYGLLRFIAGFGLAGELGLAITLVSETLPKGSRGYGTTFVASIGVCGSIAAAVIAEHFHWRTAFMIGGGLGLVLLIFRIKLHESHLYQNVKNQKISRGNFLMLFKTKERFLKYLYLILIGVPIWFTAGIIILFSPEFAQALQVSGPMTAGNAIFYFYIGVGIGDMVSGIVSQKIKSRKKVLLGFLIIWAISLSIYLFTTQISITSFYSECILLGFTTGYWIVFLTAAAEQFGTNLRSTVTTTVPNFIRGSVIPLSMAFECFRQRIGIIHSGFVLGAICLILALWAYSQMTESYEKSLDFLET